MAQDERVPVAAVVAARADGAEVLAADEHRAREVPAEDGVDERELDAVAVGRGVVERARVAERADDPDGLIVAALQEVALRACVVPVEERRSLRHDVRVGLVDGAGLGRAQHEPAVDAHRRSHHGLEVLVEGLETRGGALVGHAGLVDEGRRAETDGDLEVVDEVGPGTAGYCVVDDAVRELVRHDVERYHRFALELTEDDRAGALRAKRRGGEESVREVAADVHDAQDAPVPAVEAVPADRLAIEIVGPADMRVVVHNRLVAPGVVVVHGDVARQPTAGAEHVARHETYQRRFAITRVEGDDLARSRPVASLVLVADVSGRDLLAVTAHAGAGADGGLLRAPRVLRAQDAPGHGVGVNELQVARRNAVRERVGAAGQRQDDQPRGGDDRGTEGALNEHYGLCGREQRCCADTDVPMDSA